MPRVVIYTNYIDYITHGKGGIQLSLLLTMVIKTHAKAVDMRSFRKWGSRVVDAIFVGMYYKTKLNLMHKFIFFILFSFCAAHTQI